MLKTKKPKRGVCRVCGCTDLEPCIVNHRTCAWVDRAKTLCSAGPCIEIAIIQARVEELRRALRFVHHKDGCYAIGGCVASCPVATLAARRNKLERSVG
jgi:hypothetical protein